MGTDPVQPPAMEFPQIKLLKQILERRQLHTKWY